MNFYFCETCGKRLTDIDLEKGEGRNKKLKGVFCKDCSVGVMTMEMQSMTTEQAKQIVALTPFSPEAKQRIAAPPPASQRIRLPQPAARSSNINVLAVCLIALVLPIGVWAVYAFGKSSTPKGAVDVKSNEKPAAKIEAGTNTQIAESPAAKIPAATIAQLEPPVPKVEPPAAAVSEAPTSNTNAATSSEEKPEVIAAKNEEPHPAVQPAIVESAPAIPVANTPSAIAADIPTDGLVAHWTFDEGKGNTAADSASKSGDANLHKPAWVAGRVGGALHFDGKESIATVTKSVNLTKEFSLAVWVKTSSAKRQKVIVRRDKKKETIVNYLIIIDNGLTSFTLCSASGGGNYVGPESKVKIADNRWHHLGAVYNGSACSLYIDGKLDCSKDGIGAPKVSDNCEITIGGDGNFRKLPFEGDLDDIRVYSRALRAEELAKLASPGD